MGRTIVAGLDEFFNWLINWQMYLHALALKLLHIQPRTFMHIVGVVEIVLGIVVLTRYTRYAAYVVMVWLWCIALYIALDRFSHWHSSLFCRMGH
jgi:uncharacterized membrane protein YphA (DoxX/SURF4 family)